MIDYLVYGNSNTTGFGIHCRNIIKALCNAGKTVAFMPVQGIEYQKIDNKYIEMALNNRAYVTHSEPAIAIYHSCLDFKGKPRMGFAIFETSKIREKEIEYYSGLDVVLVPSLWGKNILIQNGVMESKIKIIHEGYDPDMIGLPERNEYVLMRAKNRGYYTFLHVGKWEKRKSTAAICKAFIAACNNTGIAATLKLKVNNPFNLAWQQEFITVCTEIAYGRIELLKNELTEKEMRYVYRDADFGLYASCGEAWNLPLLESIVSGLPCITTSWTGQGEYLQNYPKELLLQKGETETASDGLFFKGDVGNWIKPDLEEMIEKICYVLQNAGQVLSKVRPRCVESVKFFTWDAAIRGFL